MRVYNYQPDNKFFHSESIADESPLEPGVFHIPAHATNIAPPTCELHQVQIFNGTAWDIISKPEETKKYTSKNALDQYIKVIPSVLTEEACSLILNEYKSISEWESSKLSDGSINKNVRNCDIIHLSHPNSINVNPKNRQIIDNILFEASGKTIKKYVNEFPTCELSTDSGYDLLRYSEGGCYGLHIDSFKEIPRSVSCSFILNEDYEGGEFAFFNREVIIHAPKGSAVVFPSNFMYPHEIMEVRKGVRYSIITWFI